MHLLEYLKIPRACWRTQMARRVKHRSGIGVYAHWQGKTLAEERGQINGHTVMRGHVGYPKEAYDGEPYAIPLLVPEAFEREAEIPAAHLRARLDEVLRISRRRQIEV